jgi:hypothetical protein
MYAREIAVGLRLDLCALPRLARLDGRTTMARTSLLANKLLLGFATVFAAINSAPAQTVEQFYKGRTINFLV